MPDITPTGKGLTVLISCNYDPHEDWMVFASWYSIFKNLPDAAIKIACLRANPFSEFFNWTTRCQVPFIQYSEKDKNVKELFQIEDALVIKPDVMAVWHYDAMAVGPASSKSDENSTFVSYLDGCGKFVLGEWINTMRKSPFSMTSKLYADDLTLNEYRILKLWEKCTITYNTIA